MSITLYTIKSDYLRIAEELIENGGELTPELKEALNINEAEFESKVIAYGSIIQQKKYNVDMIKKEIERLKELQAIEERIENKLKESVSNAMQLYGIDKVDTPTMKLSFRKSESVEIIDEKLIPAQYLVPQPAKISKSMIKDAIKSGSEVPGASITTNFNLQIK